MENNVRTVYGAYLQSIQLLNLPFVMRASTTLNEKFNIQSGIAPVSGEMPSMKYMCIGNGGHAMQTGAGGFSAPKPIQHRSTDAALFNHMPFVLREVSNDLNPTDRAKYALRRVETHDSISYVAYYLKRLDLSNTAAAMQYNAVANNVTTTTVFTPNSSNLNPTPPVISNGGSNTVTGDYVTAAAQVTFNFTADDVSEYLNVARIINGSEDYAIISELGLVSGVDKMVQVSAFGGGTFNYNEVIAAQIATHISSFHSMQFTRTGLNATFNVGASEPLIVIA